MPKRARITEDQDKDLFGRVVVKPPKKRNEEEYSKKYGRPTTYRLSARAREGLRDLADREQIPVSTLADEAILRFLGDVEEGRYLIRKKPAGYTLAGE